MAIFASTTTSGYSDPLKAQSIKALEQRLKDQQAQAAAQQPDAAMMATIPGGIGHVLGVVGDKMNQARSDQALVANRADLAKAMSGYDMNQLTRLGIVSPCGVISKPFPPQRLLAEVRRCISLEASGPGA